MENTSFTSMNVDLNFLTIFFFFSVSNNYLCSENPGHFPGNEDKYASRTERRHKL